MMKYENLWPESIDDGYVSTNNIVAIMKQQAEYLKKKTNNNVFLRFSHIKSVTPITTMASVMSSLSVLTEKSVCSEYIGDVPVDKLKDANELYTQKQFGCEIYNHQYRFRLFEMSLPPLYPIEVVIDEGIVSDIRGQYLADPFVENTLAIDNDNEFLEMLKSVFSSRKVIYILNRLMEDSR